MAVHSFFVLNEMFCDCCSRVFCPEPVKRQTREFLSRGECRG
jgi:hypothetical protein